MPQIDETQTIDPLDFSNKFNEASTKLVVLKKLTAKTFFHSDKFSWPGGTDFPLPTLHINKSIPPRIVAASFTKFWAFSGSVTSPTRLVHFPSEDSAIF